ncbi:hypothetical protein [Paenibacillus flagellatus]|nr:hypothetical protein [Paenibacillus flagellatus]
MSNPTRPSGASAEELQLLRNAALLPVVLSVFEADLAVARDEGTFPIPGPYIALIRRAVRRLAGDIARTERLLRQCGIEIWGEGRSHREIALQYDCRGDRGRYALTRGMFAGELELLMDYYLGLFDGR